jgi:uncharacterized repeat protein (TIGR03803 family)
MTSRVQTSETRLRGVSIALAVAIMLVPAVVATQAQTYKETLLYSFTGEPDGEIPLASLIQDAAGNLYGTVVTGGTGECGYYPYKGCGTVFMLNKSGEETVLHSFTGTGGDGGNPYAGLIRDAEGNLYGTTSAGGTSDAGTVFKLSKTGKETVLYSFPGNVGAVPYAGLVRDAAGNLYGTTIAGGEFGYGTVFELSTTGKDTILYSFTGIGDDGIHPYGGLVRDAEGNLYGTTFAGGASGYGTVFKLSKTNTETVLYSFTGTPDGVYPEAGVVRDAKGNLYGTTYYGGSEACYDGYPYGCGVVYKVVLPARKRCSMPSPGPTGTAHSPSLVCSGTRVATYTGPPTMAALTAMERCSKWLPTARRPCSTASPEERMEMVRTQVCCGTRRGTFMAPRRTAALTTTEWYSSLPPDRARAAESAFGVCGFSPIPAC